MFDVFLLLLIIVCGLFCIGYGIYRIYQPEQQLRAPDPKCNRDFSEFVGSMRDYK